jgi:hypothetical protein
MVGAKMGSAVAGSVGAMFAVGVGSAVAVGSGDGEGQTVDLGSEVGDGTAIVGSRSASTRAMAGAAAFRPPATNTNTASSESSDKIMRVSTRRRTMDLSSME